MTFNGKTLPLVHHFSEMVAGRLDFGEQWLTLPAVNNLAAFKKLGTKAYFSAPCQAVLMVAATRLLFQLTQK